MTCRIIRLQSLRSEYEPQGGFILMSEIIHVNSLDQPELAPYWKLNENQLRHYFEPSKEGIFIAETANVVMRALEAGYQPLSLLLDGKYVTEGGEQTAQAQRTVRDLIGRFGREEEKSGRRIPVYSAASDVLYRITGVNLTRGILAAFRRKKLLSPKEVCAGTKRIAVLEDVENPTNIGAIFRSAAALSMDAVLLTPGCADPLQRRAVRVSMGTVFQIPWTRFENDSAAGIWPDPGIRKLQEDGFTVVSMALRRDTVPIDDPRFAGCGRLAVLLGNEGCGLSDRTISLSDATVKIPMREGVDSLNVAAASAVAFWALGNRRKNLV